MKIEPIAPDAAEDLNRPESDLRGPHRNRWRSKRTSSNRSRPKRTWTDAEREDYERRERLRLGDERYERDYAARQERARIRAERERQDRERLGNERYEREHAERQARKRERARIERSERKRLGDDLYERERANRRTTKRTPSERDPLATARSHYENLDPTDPLVVSEAFPDDVPTSPGDASETTPFMLRAWLFFAVVFLTSFVYLSSGGIGPRMSAFCGIFVIFGLVALFSKNLLAVNWQPIFFGFGLQVFLALFILKFEINDMESLGIPDGFRPGYALFEWIAGFFRLFLDFSHRGAHFVLGPLVEQEKLRAVFGRDTAPIFALSVIPTIIFVSSFFTILYYFGILQFIVRSFSRVMMTLLGTSGAETLSAVANVFMGQVESPLVVKPYLSRMTTSELLAVMVGGMATISGSLMAIYIGFGADSVAILTTSIMAAPCSLYLSKLLLPETGKPVTRNMVKTVDDMKHRNVIDAATAGAGEGLKLALNIVAMLIAFIALIELVNTFLRYFPTNTSLPAWLASGDATAEGAGLFWVHVRKYVSTMLGFGAVVWILRWPFLRILAILKLDDEYRDWKKTVGLVRFAPIVLGYFLFLGVIDILMRTLPANLTLGQIFAGLFYPLALFMGVEDKDAGRVASLLGTKLATNEFVAFLDLKALFAAHEISPRSFRLATYALTGFANFASIGIQLGGIGALAPERRADIARLGPAALFVGFLVTILNAAIAGLMLPLGDLP